MKVKYAVVGHHSRRENAIRLARFLNAALAMDEGDAGSLRNHDLAWTLAYSPGADWVIVLEDDAVLVEGFQDHVENALGHVPKDGAVSFYTGTGQPKRFVVCDAVSKASKVGCSWIRTDTLLWGPAVALPVHHVQPMLRYVRDIGKPYDQRLGQYLIAHRIPCFYTAPSLVDHEDGKSLIGDSSWPRKAHDFRQPDGWNRRYVYMI